MPTQSVTTLVAEITGNVSSQEMKLLEDSAITTGKVAGGGAFVEAGGRIVLGTATTVKVEVVDALGKVLHANTLAVTVNQDTDPIPAGVQLPLKVTTTAISSGAHTLTVYWSVKR